MNGFPRPTAQKFPTFCQEVCMQDAQLGPLNQKTTLSGSPSLPLVQEGTESLRKTLQVETNSVAFVLLSDGGTIRSAPLLNVLFTSTEGKTLQISDVDADAEHSSVPSVASQTLLPQHTQRVH